MGQIGPAVGENGAAAPIPVTGLSGVNAVVAGGNFSLALKSDGTVWGWGLDSHGELGDGTTGVAGCACRFEPVLSGHSGASAIAAGGSHSLSIRPNGTAWAAGANFYGQLGDGTSTDRSTPIPVQRLVRVQSLTGGLGFSVALAQDGTVWAWGDANAGQLGNGFQTNQASPVQAVGLSAVTSIAAGGYQSFAVRDTEQTGGGTGGGGTGGGGTGGGGTGGSTPPSATATPEMESLILFGAGFSGIASYAVLRVRARRSRSLESLEECHRDVPRV
jgi:hypothetical protein